MPATKGIGPALADRRRLLFSRNLESLGAMPANEAKAAMDARIISALESMSTGLSNDA
jgi:hypothetical protein